MPGSRVLGAALAAAALFACALAPLHEHEIADGWRGAPDARRVLLAPMNATASIAEELQPGADRTFALVKEHLAANGIAVEEVGSLFRFRDAWSRSFAGVKLRPKERGRDIPPEAIAKLVATLRRDHDFHALVMPDLEIRTARMSGMSARWDGVTRKFPDERLYFGGHTDWSGETPVVSLRIRVYAPSGERVFDSFGGLDLIFKYAGGSQMQLVDAPLSDLDHLRQGVRIAFDPLLPLGE